ncbi:MAG: hypothetical protein EOP19_31705, partial [Hyphomicrobiales bacterium]
MVQLDAVFRREKGENDATPLTPAQSQYFSSEIAAVIADLSVAGEGSISEEGRAATDAIQRRLMRLKASNGALTGRMLLRELSAANEEADAAVRVFAADAYGVRNNVERLIAVSVDRTWMAMGLAMLIAVAISYSLSRTIVPAMRNALAIAKSIAAGNFQNTITPTGGSETAELLTALAVMQDSISQHFGKIETQVATQADVYDGQIAIQNVRFEAALNNMTQGLCMFDGKARLVVVNRRFTELFGTFELGQPLATIARHPNLDGVLTAANGSFFTREMQGGRMLAVSRQIISAGGQVFTFEDVTESHTAAERLTYLANHDPLTDLPNRTRLRDRLQLADL